MQLPNNAAADSLRSPLSLISLGDPETTRKEYALEMGTRPLITAALTAAMVIQGCAPANSLSHQAAHSVTDLTPTPAPLGVAAPGIDWVSVAAPEGGTMMTAIARPTGSGRFPAILILHGTHGFAHQYVDLASEFARQGVVGVAACWFAGGRGAGTHFVTPIECSGAPPLTEASSAATQERLDALIAAIRKLSYVAPNEIGLFGHSRGGGAALKRILKTRDVVVAVLDSTGYPDNVLAQASSALVPLLILHGTKVCPGDGGSDMSTIQRARDFENAVRRERRTIEVKYYDACHNGIFENRSQMLDSVRRAADFLRRHRGD